MTREDVRKLYPHIINPPSSYYEVRNEKGTSKFRPGLTPDDYQPFIEYFTERAATAHAQARLDARKGRVDRAKQYLRAGEGWAEALRVALLRQRQSILDQVTARQTNDFKTS